MRRHFIRVSLLGLLYAIGVSHAVAIAADAPDAVIKEATKELVTAVEDARSYYAGDPDKFTAEIDRIITPIVDFNSFARGVMGSYGSKRHYASLQSDAEREQFRLQLLRFKERFREGLLTTYAKGMMTFNGQTIEVEPLRAEAIRGKSVVVKQHIVSEGSKPVVIRYKMRQNKQQQWKVRNVTIQAVNLGKVYRSQFAAAAKRYNGDIGKVIDNWVVAAKDVSS
ncbi:MAG: MlaC/ttg2D family ABC transporter substrate-binding protein [Pseudomonadales bacterium]